MSEIVSADFVQQVLSLSYDQTIVLMEKMLENLKTKTSESHSINNYAEMERNVSESVMNSMWSELKNDAW